MQHKDYSDDTAIAIDEAIREIVDTAYTTVKDILSKNTDVLHAVAEALLTREVLDGEEISILAAGKELPEVRLRVGDPPDDAARGVEAEEEQETSRDVAPIPSLDEGQPAES